MTIIFHRRIATEKDTPAILAGAVFCLILFHIEQDADVVMFIYRDDYYNKDSPKKNIAEINIAKQRNGPIGPVELVWLPQYTKFANMEKN